MQPLATHQVTPEKTCVALLMRIASHIQRIEIRAIREVYHKQHKPSEITVITARVSVLFSATI